ncbi:signal recognition particle-docking protein FtsY [Hafnia alvei]|uniref:signal recognition particle-docking protein FtsY n=1 Tax=Hafnia alvei TaxID=569 RepID=UPI001034A9B3|nr:signal recognition particle-docking protein FtsY [Hafnia alvei]TBL36987.1 signal recognition particle-docking protein FtsY [Hafnia alvei]
MAKDKKRGFFSWLGFGRQEEQPEKAQEDEQQTPPVVEETEQHQADAPSEQTTTPESLDDKLPERESDYAASVETPGEWDATVAPEHAAENLPLAEQHAQREAPAKVLADELVETTEHLASSHEHRPDAQSAEVFAEQIVELTQVHHEEAPALEAIAEPEQIEPEHTPVSAQTTAENIIHASEPLVNKHDNHHGGEHLEHDAEVFAEQVITLTEAAHPHVHQEPIIDEPYIEELVEQEIAEDDAIKHEPVMGESVSEPEPEAIDVIAEIARSEEVVDLDTDVVDETDTDETDIDDIDEDESQVEAEPEAAAVVQHEQERPTKEGFFARLKRSLLKTKQNLGSGFFGLFRGKKIDDDLFEELEEQLLIADVGVETTNKIIKSLTEHASRKELKDAESLYGKLKEEMGEILSTVDKPLDVSGHTPFVILMVGVNGVGKTTTIGKLARQFQAEGKSVMLAAGDTFRAAAVEQLQVWGERNNIPVVAQHTGADSASVIFDAIQAAKARNIDVLLADTAGRLQNKSHLMEELKKIVRVMKKLDEDAPHEVMLTIDASTGQNAVSQAKLFNEAVGLTGITLTKLDGTAKGGVIFAVADQFGIPIRYIGVGEGIEDLRPFKADDFIEALFARED